MKWWRMMNLTWKIDGRGGGARAVSCLGGWTWCYRAPGGWICLVGAPRSRTCYMARPHNSVVLFFCFDREIGLEWVKCAPTMPKQPKLANAHRRALRQSLPHVERQKKNARRIALRQSLPPDGRQARLDWRNASYAGRRDTPCLESTAMQCPKAGASSTESRSSRSHTFNGAELPTRSFITDDGNVHTLFTFFWQTKMNGYVLQSHKCQVV